MQFPCLVDARCEEIRRITFEFLPPAPALQRLPLQCVRTFSSPFNGTAFGTLLIDCNVAAASVGPVALVADSRRAVQLRHAVSQG